MQEDSDGATYPRQYLSVAFHFTAQGYLLAYYEEEKRFHRPLSGSDLDFDLELIKHPDITDEALRALYQHSGAKYPLGDQESFRKDLPLKKLEQYLGNFSVLSTEFHYEKGTRLAKAGGFDFCSTVLQVASRSGKPLLYDAKFDGRLGTLLSLELRPDEPKSRPRSN